MNISNKFNDIIDACFLFKGETYRWEEYTLPLSTIGTFEWGLKSLFPSSASFSFILIRITSFSISTLCSRRAVLVLTHFDQFLLRRGSWILNTVRCILFTNSCIQLRNVRTEPLELSTNLNNSHFELAEVKSMGMSIECLADLPRKLSLFTEFALYA